MLSFLAISVLVSPLAHAELPSRAGLRDLVSQGLMHLNAVQSRGHDGYDPGQWKAQVVSTAASLVGVGKYGVPYEDPSDFVTSSVGNVLAETYFADPSLMSIPLMVEKAAAGLGPYRKGALFQFYPPNIFNGVAVHRPRFMYLSAEWEGFTNNPPDADSTAVSYLLQGYAQLLRAGKRPHRRSFTLPPAAAAAYATFRDQNREPQRFNAAHGDRETGAFLTWLMDENDPQMPRQTSAPPDAGARIPFAKNDVDCVVNTNVLKTLTLGGRAATPGYGEACAYLDAITARSDYYNCGMYYPSQFVLAYAMASARELGVTCLEPSASRLLTLVLSNQLPDGSWRNVGESPNPDFVQSTAWALNTLLLIGDPEDSHNRNVARRGAAYLLARALHDARGRPYWPGEVFYAAGELARDWVVWRSEAYTSAVALRALVLADRKWDLFTK